MPVLPGEGGGERSEQRPKKEADGRKTERRDGRTPAHGTLESPSSSLGRRCERQRPARMDSRKERIIVVGRRRSRPPSSARPLLSIHLKASEQASRPPRQHEKSPRPPPLLYFCHYHTSLPLFLFESTVRPFSSPSGPSCPPSLFSPLSPFDRRIEKPDGTSLRARMRERKGREGSISHFLSLFLLLAWAIIARPLATPSLLSFSLPRPDRSGKREIAEATRGSVLPPPPRLYRYERGERGESGRTSTEGRKKAPAPLFPRYTTSALLALLSPLCARRRV